MKHLAALTLSTLLVVTTLSPTSAVAQNRYGPQSSQQFSQEDLIGGLIFGAVSLFVLSELIDDNKKSRSEPKSSHKPAPKPKPKPKASHKPKKAALPAHCLRTRRDNHGQERRFFANRCLQNSYHQAHRLPDQCWTQFRTANGQPRAGYRPRCLRKHNYTW